MSAELTPTELRALEVVRRQLIQLTQTIASVSHSLQTTPTLPPLESLNIQASILTTNLQNIVSHINKEGNREIFDQVVAYPSTNFPGRAESKEVVLQNLLRKKLDLDVEAWVGEGRDVGGSAPNADVDTVMTGAPNTGEDQEDITKVWSEVEEWFGERVARYVADEANAVYTAEEEAMGIENVNTGNKRDYEDESDGDEEEGEGEGKKVEAGNVGVGEEKSLEDVVRYWTTGQQEGFKQDTTHMVRKR